MLPFFYTLAVFLSCLGRERSPGRNIPVCANLECRYDLHGLPFDAPCPECGHTIRQREPDTVRFAWRTHHVPLLLMTLVPLALITLAPMLLVMAVRIPLNLRNGWIYRGPIVAEEIAPLAIAIVLSPLLSKPRRRPVALAFLSIVFATGYALSAWIAIRL